MLYPRKNHSSVTKLYPNFFCGGLIIFLLVISAVPTAAQTVPANGQAQPADSSLSAPADNTTDTDDHASAPNPRQYRLYLVLTLIIIISLFVGLILLTVIRVTRRYRRLLYVGRKNEPTEYFDAWKNYRLEDDSEHSDDNDADKK